MPAPPRIVSIDEIEPLGGPGTLAWLPVRHTLGIRAFGCNAYTAERAGSDVVEPHTEAPEDDEDAQLAHEEVYFVARGAAKFTIDGRSYDAPAGTYVFLPDPTSHRHAVAVEDGTTVLSFGGPPTFQPSGWEWAWRAAALLRSDRAQAREILQEGLGVHPQSAHLLYNLACADALDGRPADAVRNLRAAIEQSPKARQWAREDSDLADLADDPEFRALVDIAL